MYSSSSPGFAPSRPRRRIPAPPRPVAPVPEIPERVNAQDVGYLLALDPNRDRSFDDFPDAIANGTEPLRVRFLGVKPTADELAALRAAAKRRRNGV
jgi:hypothetical protein